MDIHHLAQLARIDLTSEEEKALESDIESILSYVKEIQSVDVPDDVQGIEMVHNVMREDVVTNARGEFSKDVLREAPKTQETENGTYVEVKKIL